MFGVMHSEDRSRGGCGNGRTLDNDIAEALRLLVVDPFAPQLETHKLKGKLSGSWACSAGYDLRIVFDFVKEEKGSADDILLLTIGTHDEVY